jgi:hypothetical protein
MVMGRGIGAARRRRATAQRRAFIGGRGLAKLSVFREMTRNEVMPPLAEWDVPRQQPHGGNIEASWAPMGSRIIFLVGHATQR